VAAEVIIATIMRPAGETGVQTHFQAFRRWLAQLHLPNSLITPYDSPRWLVYPVFALRKIVDRFSSERSVRWYRYWHAYFLELALQRKLRHSPACVVYAQCPLSAAAALRARKDPSQKVVMVVHFNVSQADEWAQKGMISMNGRFARSMRAFEAQTITALDGIVFVSAFMQRSLTERMPAIAAVPSAVIPNFLADPGKPDTSQPHDADLIAIGTLEPRKNQGYALDVVAAAERRGLKLRLSLVGDGPDRNALEARAKQLGVADRVRFLGFRADAAALIPRHRACLHLARIENLSLVLIESLAHGVPVFAANVGGNPEVLEDGQSGAFLPLDAADAAAEVLVRWFSDPGMLRAAGVKARTRFLERFEGNAVAQRLHSFLQEPRLQ